MIIWRLNVVVLVIVSPCSVLSVACVLGISFDKARAFDLDVGTSQGQGQVKVVREQLMSEDTKDVEPLVDDIKYFVM